MDKRYTMLRLLLVPFMVLGFMLPSVSVGASSVSEYKTEFDNIDANQIAISPDGQLIYALDTNSSTIYVLNESGIQVSQFGQEGSGDGEFSYPRGLALSPDGTKLYVADTDNLRVEILTVDGNTLSYFGEFSVDCATGGGGDHSPVGVAVSPDNTKVYTRGAYCTQINNTDTSFVSVLAGDYYWETPIVISPDGSKIYVSALEYNWVDGAPGNSAVKVLNPSGVETGGMISFDPNRGLATAYSYGLMGMALSPDGQYLYMSENSVNRIQVFNANDGSYSSTIGNPTIQQDEDDQYYYYESCDNGITDQPGRFCQLEGLAFSPDGERLYVADTGNSRIQVFEFANQHNTATLPNAVNGNTVSIQTPEGTTITCSSSSKESDNTSQDPGYTYPLGLVHFCFDTSNADNEVSLTFVTDLKPDEVTPRKYSSTTKTYSTLPDSSHYSITETTLEGKHALKLTYTLTDNGPLDQDPAEGSITDPVGLAVSNGLAKTGQNTQVYLALALTLLLISTTLVLVHGKNKYTHN